MPGVAGHCAPYAARETLFPHPSTHMYFPAPGQLGAPDGETGCNRQMPEKLPCFSFSGAKTQEV
jgi:hypothetical protein